MILTTSSRDVRIRTRLVVQISRLPGRAAPLADEAINQIQDSVHAAQQPETYLPTLIISIPPRPRVCHYFLQFDLWLYYDRKVTAATEDEAYTLDGTQEP